MPQLQFDPHLSQEILSPLLAPELFPLSPTGWQTVLERLPMPPQQAKVAQLLLYGLSDKQIAALMRRSVSTIRSHLSRLRSRTGTDDRLVLAIRLIATARTDIPYGVLRYRSQSA